MTLRVSCAAIIVRTWQQAVCAERILRPLQTRLSEFKKKMALGSVYEVISSKQEQCITSGLSRLINDVTTLICDGK